MRHFKPQSNYQAPTYKGRHFEPQSNGPTSTNGGRHFKPQDTDLNDPTKIVHITKGDTSNPIFGDKQPNKRALNKSTQQTSAKKYEVLKQLQRTQANISLWSLLMSSYKHRKNLVGLLNQIQVPITTTSQDLNAMIGSISRELTISYSDKDLTKKGKHHNNPLHITVDAKGTRILMVLIDDGSAYMCVL